MTLRREDKSIALGHPSYLWRFGQERRLGFIQRYAPLEGKRILDVGCGVGMYARAMQAFSERVYGMDVDAERAAQARRLLPNIVVAPAERLPFASGFFEVVLLHEVIEHVEDDRRAIQEVYRVLAPGGRMVIFAPNRLYPLETHGFFWQGKYHFGNIPLINWLPDPLRGRLAPHVRAYTRRDLRRLLDGLPIRVLVNTQIFPGYDKIAARWPVLGRVLRKVTYFLEKTPLRCIGLSHFLVVEKQA
ncbi:MAG: class I SAM-dependent methyltransferase [Chloroflexota bacterium]|nr:class I SAM-dependent methyltransferase [Chloroflexota bacterium]